MGGGSRLAKIAEQAKQALITGVVPKHLERFVDFQLYLTAKKIMQLKKEDRASYLSRIPECFHNRIREHALITIRYFTTSKKGASINDVNNTKRS